MPSASSPSGTEDTSRASIASQPEPMRSLGPSVVQAPCRSALRVAEVEAAQPRRRLDPPPAMSSRSSSMRAVKSKSTRSGKCCSSRFTTANAMNVGTSAVPCFSTYPRSWMVPMIEA